MLQGCIDPQFAALLVLPRPSSTRCRARGAPITCHMRRHPSKPLLLGLLALLGLLQGAACARTSLPAQPSLQVAGAAPWFCHDLDCPPFTVVNSTQDFEVRYYEKGELAGLLRLSAGWLAAGVGSLLRQQLPHESGSGAGDGGWGWW